MKPFFNIMKEKDEESVGKRELLYENLETLLVVQIRFRFSEAYVRPHEIYMMAFFYKNI